MTSERIQRQVDSLLDQTEAALSAGDWARVEELAQRVLTIDPENADAPSFLQAAERGLADPHPSPLPGRERGSRGGAAADVAPTADFPEAGKPRLRPLDVAAQPASFANGRYAVKRFLGEGGKKKVYLAHDTLLDRDVAFALIKTEGLDEVGRQRITREAQSMGRLGDHPNIVTVYDIGEEAVGISEPQPEGRGMEDSAMPRGSGRGSTQPYMVLPLLPGGDVEGLIEKAPEHRLPIEQVVQIGVEVCQGLEFAHAKGIVHRDLKPGNVWLAQDGRAQIGDFGLAVAVDKSRLTQTGMMVGTVNYMPPEQAMGGEVGPRSDLYSLGCMLYEMACGRPPFVGDESVAIIGQHLNTPPVAPSWHRPDCPPALEALVLRLLEKDPAKRPTDAHEVREALQNAATPVGVQHAGPLQRPDGERAVVEQAQGPDPLYRRTFVGREQELRQLHAAFDAALSGRGSLAMVVGEPGIGKTSVCEQLATYAALRGGKSLIGHCYEEGSLSLPYLPFVEAMRSYVLAREPDDLRKELGSGASEVARIVSEVRDKVQVSPSDGGDPEEQRWRLLQAVTSFLRNASLVQPLLLVLEDLHDADRGTLDLLLHLSRNLEGARLLIVGTYRDVEVDRAHPLSAAVADLRRAGSFLRVPLRGLTVDEVHRMYEAIRGNPIPWAQAELVHRQTEGNPLFVQEVLRYLVEEGLVVREGGQYVAREGVAAAVPEGLRDVVGRRLNRLSEKSNQVLSVAAVVGREFRLDVLQKVAGLPEDEIFAALEEAQERAIIEQRQMLGGVGFRFTHAFFRQTLYEEIFAPRRIRWHQQVGRALEDVHARRLEEHAAELAEHFAQSTETGDLEKAVRYSELAAQRAIGVFAYGEAERHLEQALRAQDVRDPDNRSKICDLLLSLGDALLPLGQPRRVLEAVAPQAYELASVVSDDRAAFRACRLALDAHMREGASSVLLTSEYHKWAQRAELHSQVGTPERAYSDVVLGLITWRRDFNQGLALAERGFNAARSQNDVDLQFFAAWNYGSILWSSPEHWELLFEIGDEIVGLVRAGVSARNLSRFFNYFGLARLAKGDRSGWEILGAELVSLAQRTQDANVIVSAKNYEVQKLIIDGRLEQAVEVAAAQLDVALELGLLANPILGPLYQAAFYIRSPGEALDLVPRATSSGDAQAAALYFPMLLAAGWTASFDAETSKAMESELDTFCERDDSRTFFNAPQAVMRALFAATYLGRRDITQKILHDPPFHPSMKFVGGVYNYSINRLFGVVQTSAGGWLEARGYFEAAIDACEALPHRPELALARLGLAELLLEHYPDERTQAIEHLDFAIGEFREMKMQPSLERALRHRGLLKA